MRDMAKIPSHPVDTPQFMDFSDGDKGSIPRATQQARFARSSAKVEQPPFDGLERLQAAIYPQQNGQRPKSVALSQAPTPATQTPAVTGEDVERRMANTPARSERAAQPVQSTDNTPQQVPAPTAPTTARSASPTKPVAPSTAVERAPSVAPPNPPPAFNAGSRSRPASRAGERAEAESMQTTAERLQHQASQKRLSDLANPNPNYPYASSTPKAAKPFVPDASGADLRASPSAMLPPMSSGPGVPSKPAEAKEDPLLAALAKLRSPSSAVDVLPPTSPGVPGGTSPAAVQAVRLQSQQSQQQLRSQSPYGQHPGSMDGRKSPSMPAVHQQQQYAGGMPQSRPPVSQQYPLPGQGQYGRAPMAPSQSQPAYMNGSVGGSPAPGQYAQARSRPASPNPQAQARAPSPSAAMMRPPSSAGNPDPGASGAGYGQAFPGERRQSIARPNNLAQPNTMQGQGSQSRPSSPAPQASVPGAGLRSPPTAGAFVQTGRASPSPGQGPAMYPAQMRSPSPGPPSAPGAGYAAQQGQQSYGAPAAYPQGQSQGYGAPPATGRPQSAYQPTGPNGGYMRPTSAAGNGSMGHRPTQSYGGQVSGSPAPGQLSQSQPGAGRPTTPLGGGISLNASGQVTQDGYGRPGQQQQPSYQSQNPQANLPPQQQSAGFRHGASIYRNSSTGPTHSPGPGQQPQVRNSMTSPAPVQQPGQPMSPVYGGPSQQTAYGQQSQQGYQRAQSPYVQQPSQSYVGGPPPQQQQQQPAQPGMRNSQSMSYDQSQQYQQQQGGMQASQSYRGQQQRPQSMYTGPPQQSYQSNAPPPQQQPSPAPVAPSQQPLSASSARPPTGQYTESGHPILFYVKAIYKYDASSPEEFSFQKDDVIGVFGKQ